MKRHCAQQVHKVSKIYQHHFLKTQQTLSLEKQSFRQIKQELDENSQAICQIETRLANTQKVLIAAGQLSQWQAYQYHSKAQGVLIGQLASQKSKLEIKVAVAQMAVDKTLSKLKMIKHKSNIMEKLEKSIQHEKNVRTNEIEDETSVQQWQLSQPVIAV